MVEQLCLGLRLGWSSLVEREGEGEGEKRMREVGFGLGLVRVGENWLDM